MISHFKHLKTKLHLFTTAFFMLSLTAFSQVGSLLWEENFNAIDPEFWSYDIGDGCDIGICGWGNAELQYYRSENSRIEAIPGESGNNALVIEARREDYGGYAFTSSRLKSEGGVAVQYGLIEIRMQVPNLETGLWPAAWMLGTSTATWPAKGEIDIMEMGHNLAERTRQGYPSSSVNNYVGSNLIFYADGACSDANPSCAASTAYDVDYDMPYVPSTSLNDRFMIYRLYWTSTSMRFTVIDNDVEHDLYAAPFAISDESLEFQAPFYFLLNLAVGGTFTDALTNDQVTAPLPGKMLVDYIRVYQYDGQGEVMFGSTAIKESGTFGIFTDNTPTTNKLEAGVSSDIYAWNNFAEGTTAPYEGSNVIAWQTTDAAQWFGGGIQTRQARDMSSFVDGNLKFRIKIPADVSFRIGITDNYTNAYYVQFPASQTTYGLVRNGEWGQATIPISDLTGGIIALQSMQYMFAIVSVDGALPASTFQLGLDDIYWEGGGDEPDVPVTGVTVSPSSATLDIGGTQQLTASISPSNATNQAVSWSSSNSGIASVNSNGLVSAVSAGSATITATTADGGYTSSCNVTVNQVVQEQSPYNGVIQIPGTVEMENYDNGGEGIAYHDADDNNKSNTYRFEGVDIEACGEGGYNIDWSVSGEWLEYTVNVATTGSYTMDVRVASPIGGSFHVEFDGSNVSGVQTVPNTGGWQNWQTVSTTVNLTAGQHIMRFFIDQQEFNTNYIAFTLITDDLPSPWENSDVGAVGAAGSAEYSSGTFTVIGSGADIWGTTDEFQYVHQQVNGDVTITARVASLTNTDGWAKAGVMIRNSLDGNSVHALTAVTSANGTAFQRRTSAGGESTHTAGPSGTAPYWVRLQRSGSTFTSYVSTNGSSWSQVGSQSISMNNTVYVGLAVTSHNDGTLCTAPFDNVDVSMNSTVPVSGVSVSPTIAALTVGGSVQLSASVSPSNATNQNVSWSSSNSGIASVNSSGLVTANATGSATITVTTADGGYTASCSISVASVNIPVTGVSISQTSLNLTVGGSQQLTANVSPSNATNQGVSWSSSNSGVASVNSSGLVTANAAGSATVTVTTADGSYTASCSVSVTGGTTADDITDLGGTVTSQYTDWPTGEGITNLIDNNVNTKYLTFHNAAWVQYQAVGSYVVTGYSIASANDVPDRDPLDWNLQGSNDGANWTTLDTRSGEDFPNRFQTRTFTFSNSAAFSYYRFNMNNNAGSILQLAEIELFGTESSTPSDFSVLIEAEDWANMSGVQTESCSEGGLNVGWIDTGDWIVWDVDLPSSEMYTVEYRVASLSAGGTIEFEKAGGSPDYGTIDVPVTGGWQNWTTISHTVTLDAGAQQVAINVLAGGWNINWLQITRGVKSAEQQTEGVLAGNPAAIYPNPVNDVLNLKLTDDHDNISVQILNSTGTLQYEGILSNGTATIDVSMLHPGIYIVRLFNGENIVNELFIKN